MIDTFAGFTSCPADIMWANSRIPILILTIFTSIILFVSLKNVSKKYKSDTKTIKKDNQISKKFLNQLLVSLLCVVFWLIGAWFITLVTSVC